MRNFKLNLPVFIIAIIGFFFIACADETSTLPKSAQQEYEVDLNGMNVELDSLNLNSKIILYDKSIEASMETQIEEKINDLVSEVMDDLNNDDHFTDFIFKTEYINGNIVIQEYSFVNTDEKSLEKFELNDENDQYEKESAIWSPDYDGITGDAPSCPDGYKKLGACKNTGDVESCIGNYVSGYYSENLRAPGDCASTTVKVGLLSTTVCGKNADYKWYYCKNDITI